MAAAPACPGCKRKLDRTGAWRAEGAECPDCHTALEFIAFPALTAVRAAIRPQVAAVAEDATCFFHAENRADTVCESCGRYLCAVCGFDYGGSRLCPACAAARRRTESGGHAKEGVVLYDTMAVALAILPLLIFPITLVTGPITLGYVVYAWRKPLGLLRRSRWRLVAATFIALLEITGWVIYFVVR